jgi:hypothetical protein
MNIELISSGILVVAAVVGGLWKLAGDTIKLQRDQIDALLQWKVDAEQQITKLQVDVEIFKEVPLKQIADSISDIVKAQAVIVNMQNEILRLVQGTK